MAKKALVGTFIAGAMVFALQALPVSALTIDDVQAQINQLLSQIRTLTAQLDILKSQQNPPPIIGSDMPSKHRVCQILYRNLTQGARGDDVIGLQEFLHDQGYLSANATGYFGSATAQAVASWQNSQGVTAVGSFGPMSRERIKIWCGRNTNFTATPMRGDAPLSVTFRTTTNPQTRNNSFTVDFGDGTSGTMQDDGELGICVVGAGGPCNGYGGLHVSHIYNTNGMYTATLATTKNPGQCTPAPCFSMPVIVELGKVQINVGPIACSKEYKPVCGSKQIYCITTPCNPVPTTYGNRCEMNADGANLLYEGQCRTGYKNPADDQQCKAWSLDDGCNSCSRSEPGGPSRCTAFYCGSLRETKPYCTAWFDNSGNKPPVISGFSGPTTLSVNQQGTWTINASDPENGQLNYIISWGDEYSNSPYASSLGIQSIAVQTSTFTHAYANAGTYTVRVTVRDNAGQEAKTSTTVQVGGGGTICTAEYAPVCAQPPIPTCSQGFECPPMAMPSPRTYSNRCMMNAANATFLHSGACTGTLNGNITVGPLCPVQSQYQQCQTVVNYGAYRLFVYASDGTTLITTITADTSGNYSTPLSEGDYKIKVENAGSCSADTGGYSYRCYGMSNTTTLIPVRIYQTGISNLYINIDTGIR